MPTPTPIYIALIHYPVTNKHGEIVTTSLTNFDIHDLARTTTTFGVQKCFLVTPVKEQQDMVHYIKRHWSEGFGASYNADRKRAFQAIEIKNNLDETRLTIQNLHDKPAKLIATSARSFKNSINFKELRRKIQGGSDEPHLFIFGTGWGLADSVMDEADQILEPICGPCDYNHLPVRAAVAIILDRLVGLERT